MVLNNFKSRRLRSFLTLLGIVIGIISIILLYSFAESIQDVVAGQFENLGTDKIWIASKSVGFGMPGGAQGLTEDDVETIENVKGIDFAVYYYSDSVPVEVKDTEILTTVQGINTKVAEQMYETMDRNTESGRGFYNNEKGNIVVIGGKVAESFDTKLYPNNKININDKKFRIIGILEETGDSSVDYLIQIPIDSMRDITGTDNEISGIMAVVLPGIDVDKVTTNIEKHLERDRGDDNFLVVTPAQVQEQAEETIGVVKLVILAIAAVSIIVGGLGIMNSMYTSVLERTKEIGIMKAIGAKNNDVLSMFLLEAGLLGLIGGLISLIISFVIIQVANIIISQMGTLGDLIITLKPEVAAGAIIFAIGIGMISGLFPAYRAMKLKPVDALRYE
jgi:putative ABC transport system permease protein